MSRLLFAGDESDAPRVRFTKQMSDMTCELVKRAFGAARLASKVCCGGIC
jgi:hypothetical protein